MRIAKLSKVLALAGLGVGTFLVGNFAMSRLSTARPAQDVAERITVETRELRPGERAIPAGAGKTYHLKGPSYGGSQPLVVSDGDSVLISASYNIRDNRPNLGYVWAVHVFLPEDTDRKSPVFEHWFAGQPIEVKMDQEVDPVLLERLPIPLPRGDYLVYVGAYRVRPDVGMAGLMAKPAAQLVKYNPEGFSMGTRATIGL